MKPDPRFLRQPKHFWANTRIISQQVGYTVRGSKKVRAPNTEEMQQGLISAGITTAHLANVENGEPTELGRRLSDYFQYRADVLNRYVEPQLMDAEDAHKEFEIIQQRYPRASCPIPMNKQKGGKQVPAYLTGMVNLLIEANIGDATCDYNPQKLTTVTHKGAPLRTLSRRVDGAFPSTVDPIAIWEIKEYYHTTTFGSRVADGVYETQLDGLELEELQEQTGLRVQHYLMVDSHYTWWECGRSYLCRIIDMLHMGLVDEVLFGREVIERIPEIVQEWGDKLRSRG